jgi:hypothetical protein
VGGASPLFIPSPPRFIRLEGVTGVILGAGSVELVGNEVVTCTFAVGGDALSSDWDAGTLGGGIDKSTGEGVSPGMSPLPLRPPVRVERRRGVEDADFVLRCVRFVEFGVRGTRWEADGRCRVALVCSSPCGDAVRLLRRECCEESGLYASIQGLKGERSKSMSPGEGRGIGGVVLNTRLAGAERALCSGDIC